jgi:glycosyltransferase involved in cell wall biosynthesis/Tfp pilus assembly protein PilF
MDVQKTAELRARISKFPDDCASYFKIADIYIDAGQYRDAYTYLARLAEKVPESTEVLSTVGAVAVRLEKHEEALSYFGRAAAVSPGDKDLFHNIGLLHAARDELPEAEAAFRRVVELDPNDAQGLNDLAVILAHQKKTVEARQAFKSAMGKNPCFEKAHENFAEFCLEERSYEDGLEAIERCLDRATEESPRLLRWRRAFIEILDSSDSRSGRLTCSARTGTAETTIRGLKIAFFSTQSSFANDILERLSEGNEIKRFSGSTTKQIEELMQWADVAWFEWCDELLIQATKLTKTCPIICRLHSYEAFTDMPAQVDWSKVDRLILVSRNVSRVLDQLHSIPTDKVIVPNGVDLKKFAIPENKVYGKKICSLGYINYKKNPGLLLHCFKAIHDWDPTFEFHIAGQHQDHRIRIYMNHALERLKLPVRFDNWVHDVPAYLQDKDFIISTSLFESFHYSIAEGMASGVLPLIHAWPGSEDIYPADYLYDTPSDCVDLVKRLMRTDRNELARENRSYIADNFSLERTIEGLIRVIEELCTDA